MTHTPGPWTIEEGEYTGSNWLIGTLFVGTDRETDDDIFVHITTDHIHASQLGYTRALDDARLIAAAPRLLEVCKMAYAAILSDTHLFNQPDERYKKWSGLHKELINAITTAEGEL